jgi:hypothetical protein
MRGQNTGFSFRKQSGGPAAEAISTEEQGSGRLTEAISATTLLLLKYPHIAHPMKADDCAKRSH